MNEVVFVISNMTSAFLVSTIVIRILITFVLFFCFIVPKSGGPRLWERMWSLLVPISIHFVGPGCCRKSRARSWHPIRQFVRQMFEATDFDFCKALNPPKPQTPKPKTPKPLNPKPLNP